MHTGQTVWHGKGNPNIYRGGRDSVIKYNKCCLLRREMFPYKGNEYTEAVQDVNNQGFHIFRNVIDKETVQDLRREFESQIESGENIKEKNNHFAVIDQPLLHCPTVAKLAFSDLVIKPASEYFQCVPALGTLNFRKSYVTKEQAIKHQLFHVDPNSIKFVKFFFYLNDVDKSGGPLTIVKDSGHKRFVGWDTKYRWSKEEMEQIYGKDSVKYLTANAGDVIMAAPTCFHRGTKPESSDRTMLTLNYVVHPEEFKPPSCKIRKEDAEKLSEDKKPLADFLIVE